MPRARAAILGPITPRGFSREEAAAYVGIGATKFDEMVRDGRMPPAKIIDGRRVWDVRKLDIAFDDLSDAGENQWAGVK